MPGSDWAPLAGKFLGLALVLAVFRTLLMLAGMLAQPMLGYARIRDRAVPEDVCSGCSWPSICSSPCLRSSCTRWCTRSTSATWSGRRYVFIAMPALFGVEHTSLVYGAGPGGPTPRCAASARRSCRGSGFKLYWAAWALLLAVVARLLGCGAERRGSPRGSSGAPRFTPSDAAAATAAVALVAHVGGFIVYNTNVLNAYSARRPLPHARRSTSAATAGPPHPAAAIVAPNCASRFIPTGERPRFRGTYRAR